MQTETVAKTGGDDGARSRDDIREEIRHRGSNINGDTLLATDYLNHFNEIVMMIEMAADMPESFEFTEDWHPMAYGDHFAQSNLGDKDLAIEAYEQSPEDVRTRFDGTTRELEDHLVDGLRKAGAALHDARHGAFHTSCRDLAADARTYIDELSAIIHGHHEGISSKQALDAESLEETQATIDCLFGT